MHAPLTAETRGLIAREQIALLPSGAVVVNASRAGLVDAEALLEALTDGGIAGVALDVLEVEPPTADAPAPRAPRLVVNPHAGWYSQRASDAAVVGAVESVREALGGRRPPNALNHPAAR